MSSSFDRMEYRIAILTAMPRVNAAKVKIFRGRIKTLPKRCQVSLMLYCLSLRRKYHRIPS